MVRSIGSSSNIQNETMNNVQYRITSDTSLLEKSKSRQRSGNDTIRKNFPLQIPL